MSLYPKIFLMVSPNCVQNAMLLSSKAQFCQNMSHICCSLLNRSSWRRVPAVSRSGPLCSSRAIIDHELHGRTVPAPPSVPCAAGVSLSWSQVSVCQPAVRVAPAHGPHRGWRAAGPRPWSLHSAQRQDTRAERTAREGLSGNHDLLKM